MKYQLIDNNYNTLAGNYEQLELTTQENFEIRII